MQDALRNAEFLKAILKALEQVGDESAVRHVYRLIRAPVISKSQMAVRNAAHECLPYLQASAGRQKVSDELLRPAMPEAESPDTLVRPAMPMSDQDPQSLLRAPQPPA
jgi:hypothetical protein